MTDTLTFRQFTAAPSDNSSLGVCAQSLCTANAALPLSFL